MLSRWRQRAIMASMFSASILISGCATTTSKHSSTPSAAVLAASTAPPTPTAIPTRGTAQIVAVKEPNDYAHRNYCGAGATQVLLSAWMSPIPDIETVAQMAHLDVNRGQSGADTLTAINEFLAFNADTKGVRAVYQGRHVEEIGQLVSAIQAGISGLRFSPRLGHGGPLLVQTMTGTLPGWNKWQATHMITVYAFDFSTGDPNRDTVSYVETPSTVAAYTGPPTQSVTLAALWQAMVAHNRDAPDDPINLIS